MAVLVDVVAQLNLDAATVEATFGKFFTDYTKKYGYNDLFLIDAKGYAFYTVAKEPDYQTNLVDGKYKDSNLGGLIRKVIASKSYGIADFAPYAASNGEPAGFIAQPLLDKDGKVAMIVALQLSLESINEVMQQRDGMGETGETYLVGSDLLMRSDSFLDKTNHTVKASFANPAKGKVDTVGAREALSGKTGAKIIIDYNNNPVLSAYTPLKIGEFTWALLAEIDEAEAFAVIKKIQLLMLVLALVGIALISGAGLLIAGSIAKPIMGMTNVMLAMAGGNKQVDIPSQDAKDEIGEMAKAMQVFKEGMIKAEQLEMEARAAQAKEVERGRKRELLTADFDVMIRRVIAKVTSTVDHVHSASNSLHAAAEQTGKQSQAVAAAAEQASSNVQTVASATEELGSSTHEISSRVQDTTRISREAVTSIQKAGSIMTELSGAAQKIGEVVNLINDIASQTNLLALNATIEAARAGDAGKGFAVVAGEVKHLANQTTKATDEIAGQIGAVQSATKTVVDAIRDVTTIIGRVDEVVSSIASAVEEQNAATQEIARNVAEAATGTGEVTRNISEVSSAAKATGVMAEEMTKVAEELQDEGVSLGKHVETFLASVKAV